MNHDIYAVRNVTTQQVQVRVLGRCVNINAGTEAFMAPRFARIAKHKLRSSVTIDCLDCRNGDAAGHASAPEPAARPFRIGHVVEFDPCRHSATSSPRPIKDGCGYLNLWAEQLDGSIIVDQKPRMFAIKGVTANIQAMLRSGWKLKRDKDLGLVLVRSRLGLLSRFIDWLMR